MKKVNKALMSTVAILLSLVLITTSVVSGIFAKFVETKSAGATVSLKAFGLELEVNKQSADSWTPETIDKNTLSVSVAYQLIASKDNQFVLSFTPKGTPNVDKVKLSIKIDIEEDDIKDFYLTTDDVSDIAVGYHIPVGFITQVKPDTARLSSSKYWVYTSSATSLKNDIIKGIHNDIKAQIANYKNEIYDISYSNNVLEMEIWNTKKGSSLAITDILFGFLPYKDKTTTMPSEVPAEKAHILQTYICEREPTLKVKYTVSIEQVVG